MDRAFGTQVNYLNVYFQLATPEGGTDVSINLAIETRRFMGIPMQATGIQMSVTQPHNPGDASPLQGGLSGAQIGIGANFGVMEGGLEHYAGQATQVSADIGFLGVTAYRSGDSSGDLSTDVQSIIVSIITGEDGTGIDIGFGTGLGAGGSSGEVYTYPAFTVDMYENE